MERIRDFMIMRYKFTFIFTLHYILLLTECHNWTPTMIVGHVGHANKHHLYRQLPSAL